MKLIRKTDVLPIRPVIITLYGVPGSGKTSVAATADHALLIDTDRGFDRAIERAEGTLAVQKWQDVLDVLPDVHNFKTVILDTAKGCLDDFCQPYVCEKNYKLKSERLALKRYGAMADEFGNFINRLQQAGVSIFIICHDKEGQDGDTICHRPDCTGQSKELIIRKSDQVGYVHVQNGRRVITFGMRDNLVTKDVAGLGDVQIPDFGTPDFEGFAGREIIERVQEAIVAKGEAQKAALAAIKAAREALDAAATDEDAAHVVQLAGALPDVYKKPFFEEMKKKLDYDEKVKTFHVRTTDQTA